MRRRFLCFALLSLLSAASHAADKQLIRLGVMASGTLAWELEAIQHQGLLNDAPFRLETITLANQQAGKVALQSGSVDLIVSDWIWVSSMRAEGADYTFSPYSNSAGGLIVEAGSPIKSLADLKGKKLGIAGGELDKNWLLLQALGLQQGIDLNQSVEKVYGAPPLLEQQLKSHRIDALLTYWQFAARLEADGYQQLLNGEQIIQQLGIKSPVPSLGYVFKQSWGEQHRTALQQFLKAGQSARNQLCSDDGAWEKIAHLTETDNHNSQQQIRSRYCQGRIGSWTADNQQAADQIYQLLRQLSDNKLTGKAEQIQAGSFWSAD